MHYDMLLPLTSENIFPQVHAIPLFSKKGGSIYVKILTIGDNGYMSHNAWQVYTVPNKIFILGIAGDVEMLEITDSSAALINLERFDKSALPGFQSKAEFIYFIKTLLYGE